MRACSALLLRLQFWQVAVYRYSVAVGRRVAPPKVAAHPVVQRCALTACRAPLRRAAAASAGLCAECLALTMSFEQRRGSELVL